MNIIFQGNIGWGSADLQHKHLSYWDSEDKIFTCGSYWFGIHWRTKASLMDIVRQYETYVKEQ